MTTNRADIYQTVTDTIIEAIENGISGKLEMPWHQINSIPENAKTGNCYQASISPCFGFIRSRNITPCLFGRRTNNGPSLAHR